MQISDLRKFWRSSKEICKFPFRIHSFLCHLTFRWLFVAGNNPPGRTGSCEVLTGSQQSPRKLQNLLGKFPNLRCNIWKEFGLVPSSEVINEMLCLWPIITQFLNPLNICCELCRIRTVASVFTCGKCSIPRQQRKFNDLSNSYQIRHFFLLSTSGIMLWWNIYMTSPIIGKVYTHNLVPYCVSINSYPFCVPLFILSKL